MTDLTDQQIEALDAAATPGPWSLDALMIAHNFEREDAEFASAARTLVPSLLAAKKEAVARAQKAEAENGRLRDACWTNAEAMAERDALAARLASAEAKLAKVEEALWCFHFIEGNPLQADGLAVVERVRAALAGADTTPEPTGRCHLLCDRSGYPHTPHGVVGAGGHLYRCSGRSATPEQEAGR